VNRLKFKFVYFALIALLTSILSEPSYAMGRGRSLRVRSSGSSSLGLKAAKGVGAAGALTGYGLSMAAAAGSLHAPAAIAGLTGVASATLGVGLGIPIGFAALYGAVKYLKYPFKKGVLVLSSIERGIIEQSCKKQHEGKPKNINACITQSTQAKSIERLNRFCQNENLGGEAESVVDLSRTVLDGSRQTDVFSGDGKLSVLTIDDDGDVSKARLRYTGRHNHIVVRTDKIHCISRSDFPYGETGEQELALEQSISDSYTGRGSLSEAIRGSSGLSDWYPWRQSSGSAK